MKLVVFGATGPTGRLVVQQALDAGHDVTAVTRRPDSFSVRAAGLSVVGADVADADGVDRAVGGTDAVISTFGVPYGRKPITLYSTGVSSILRSMHRHGVMRLVCVSSTSVSMESAPGESLLWRRALKPFLRRVVGRTLYDDMERMEQLVQASDRDWTIVRPAGLFTSPTPTRDYEVSTRHLLGRVTSRADLAETLVREAVTPRHPRSVIEVITRSETPTFTHFLRETLGRDS